MARAHAELETAAQRHAVRRGHHRDACILHALRRVLVALHHLADLIELTLARRHDDEEQVRADAEVLALVGDDERAEVGLRLVDRLADHRDDVGVDAVGLGLEGEPEHAVAEVPRFGAVVLEHRLARCTPRAPNRSAELRQCRVARVGLLRDVLAFDEIEHLPVLRVEGGGAARLHLLDGVGQLVAGLLHRLRGLGEAERVPDLEGAELPVVAPLHRVIDGDHRVGDLADATRRVREALVEDLAREIAGLALIGHELLHALARVLDLGEALGSGLDRLVAALGAVLAGLGIERGDLLVGAALEEAALGLVAELLLLDHLADVRGDLEDLPVLVLGQRVEAVVRDVRERVEADEICRAEARALGVRHGRAGDVVDVLGREAVLQHLVDGGHHGVRADAVTDEVRRVLAEDDALAERVLREADAMGDDVLVGLGTGDDLEELHVANGVEEVENEEVLLEVRGASFGHLRDAEA